MLSHVMPVYAPAPVVPVSGKGLWLYEANGTAWIDCIGGIATNALGHCHPALVDALALQSHALWHVSNALCIPGQAELGAKLTAASFAELAFFCNSGTEAVECAIKTARRYHAVRGAPERSGIIGFHGSFHGRTYAAINASGNPAYLEGCGPLLPGFDHFDIADRAGLAAAVARPTTAAVIVEPVQGEGGARALADADLLRLRQLCSAHGVLLIHDEVQCGMGRTGRLFAHQWVEGAAPDIMAIAKALGGGFPVGACLATADAASGMTAASHGSTFGGNPLAMAVAGAAFDIIADPDMLAHVRAMSEQLRSALETLRCQHPDIIVDVRGKGLLIGLKLAPNNRAFIAAARQHGLLLAGGGDNIVRLLPPLTVSAEEAEMIVERIAATCMAMICPAVA
ncbi:aspartate aminotransferase family protein [Blastomonas sp. UPD001]|uniref:aspartate aminotransferase family protein n=1 Tax=Blastomonas sp. UPD001 TaxID=2217673 RepID=UPI000E340D24|nr:aspartate aminotransferase family protein [Blastomonas sp. UPD001]